MEIVLLLTAIVFLTSPSFWGFVIFHFATGMIAIWLFGLWLGY